MLPTDLPGDLPSFLKRFGTDARCRAYLVRARWPAGFRCTGCGHDQAWSHKKRLIEECTACGKQHSILAGTIFDNIDYLTSNIMLPLGGLLIVIFAGWVMCRNSTSDELGSSGTLFKAWRVSARFIAPIGILLVLINAVL